MSEPPVDAGQEILAAVRRGYAVEGPCLEIGALILPGAGAQPQVRADAPVRVPLAMLNRHGLVAGATGTGKTKTLQLLTEQLSAAGVPVFAADIKGDLSGLAAPGEPHPKIAERAGQVGQPWAPAGCPVELLALGGEGDGVPARASISAFGPTLLAKVLDLNDTQESSLGLVFHYADKAGLPLLDLADLRAVVQHLLSDEGKAELRGLGGLATSTAGVILRKLIAFEDQGAEAFFGEPEFDVADLLRTAGDGRGVVTLLELPRLQDRPAVFSTFLMWLLAQLYEELPEVGDLDKPKLVFFFDEAHLLFADASKAFLDAIGQTVRLIRSKGVGVFFVTQAPQDVPDFVLAQLGHRVQHALRAFTPADEKALRATARTFPRTAYDLEEVLTTAGTGEAVVTVLSERGTPTPVAWTLLRAPQSLMAPAPAEVLAGVVEASPLRARYAEELDRESARELLAGRLTAVPTDTRTEEQRLEDEIRGRSPWVRVPEASTVPSPSTPPGPPGPPRHSPPPSGAAGDLFDSPLVRSALRSAGTALGREIVRGIFGTGRRRRR